MFERFGRSPEDADVRARTLYLVQIGYISMRVNEPLLPRLDRIPPYALTFTGLALGLAGAAAIALGMTKAITR